MKERGFNLKSRTRSQWRLRESRLKWKKKRARRKRVLKIAFFIVEVIGIIFCISTGISIEETSAYAKSTIVVFQDEEPEMEEIFEEKKCEIKEFDANTDLKSEIYIIGEKVESTEASQIEETDAETESALETEEAEDATIVEELIAEHTIDNPNSKPDRNTNLAVAADIINGETDGYILEPGEKFSWIEVVGKTTEEKGFKKAPEYQNGKLVQGMGGGICQVSTTINSTIQKTEQKTDEEHFHAEPHSITLKTGKPPAYIKPERGDKEASVASSVGKDFWFVNSLEYSIRMHIETNGGAVTVQVFKREIIPN